MEAAELVLLVIIIALQLASLAQHKARRYKMSFLMRDGEIDSSCLSAAGLSVEELFSAARQAGYFNLGDVDTAVLEENGKISFLPKPMSRCLNPKDFNFAPVRDGVPSIIVKNGELVEENLEKAGIKREEVMTILLSRGRRLENILLATITESGRVDVFEKAE